MKPALLIVLFSVLDKAELEAYQSSARPTLLAHGAQPVAAGPRADLLGETSFTHGAVFRFPSREAVEAWFSSEAYRATAAVRDRAMDARFLIIEE